MKKKLFLGIGILFSFSFLFFALDSNNSSVFKASLLEESPQFTTVRDWKNAFESNDKAFFQKNITSSYQEEFFQFLENSPLKMDISIKKITNKEIFFSFFGAKKGSSKLNDNNYGYIGKDFLLLSPVGSFTKDEFNTSLFTNTSSFPLFLDGEYLVISKKGEEFSAELILLEEVEKNYIQGDELFTVETLAENFTQIESIKYGFTLSLEK